MFLHNFYFVKSPKRLQNRIIIARLFLLVFIYTNDIKTLDYKLIRSYMLRDEHQKIRNSHILLMDSKYQTSRNFNKFVNYHRQTVKYYL